MTSSLIQSGSPPARARRAALTASSAVSAPEVLGSRSTSGGRCPVMSSPGSSKSMRRTATVTIAQREAITASRMTSGESYLPLPVSRRERNSRPAMTSGSWMTSPFAGMTQIRFYGRGLRGHLSAPDQGLPSRRQGTNRAGAPGAGASVPGTRAPASRRTRSCPPSGLRSRRAWRRAAAPSPCARRPRLEQVRAALTELGPAARLEHAQLTHVLDVRARDECLLARAREDHHASLLVRGELRQAVPQRLSMLEVECVQRVRPVDGDRGDAAVALDVDAHRMVSRKII